MSGVDVLAVMDDVANNILIPSGGSYADELSEARAAVAELIEADVSLDAADSALASAVKPADPHTQAEWEQDSLWRDLRDALRDAKKRRTAALARVTGGAA